MRRSSHGIAAPEDRTAAMLDIVSFPEIWPVADLVVAPP
jgi:hypothetical protein